MPIDPKYIITREEHDAEKARILEESPDHIILHEYPASDIKRTEEILGVEEGTFPPITIRFAKGDELCSNCGRHFTVLDLVNTAIKPHGKEFLIEVIFGDQITRGEGGQTLTCYQCGQRAGGPMAYCHTCHTCEV